MRYIHLPCFIRAFIFIGLALVIYEVVFNLVRYPLVIATAGAGGPVYLGLFVLVVVIYAWFAIFQTRGDDPFDRIALQSGAGWGLLLGIVWIIEVTLADLLISDVGWFKNILYYASTAAGFLLPFVPGLLAAVRTGKVRVGLRAGVLSGMAGGLILFLFTFMGLALFLTAGRQDPQTLREFQRSGLGDLDTYIVGDYLAAMITHLLIGLVTGLVLGSIGGLIGKALSPSSSKSH